MPAGRSISTAIRRIAIRLIPYQSLSAREWLPWSQGLLCSQQKSRYTNFVPCNARKDDQEPRDEFNEDGPGPAETRQQHKLTVDTLHRRLRHPRRRKGHEGSNINDVPENPPKENGTGFDGSVGDATRIKDRRIQWWNADTGALEKDLSTIAHNTPSVRKIQRALKILVSSRSVKPTTSHYEAAVLANCDPQLGSVKAVESILEEMERENIAIGLSVYVAALKVGLCHQGSSKHDHAKTV